MIPLGLRPNWQHSLRIQMRYKIPTCLKKPSGNMALHVINAL